MKYRAILLALLICAVCFAQEPRTASFDITFTATVPSVPVPEGSHMAPAGKVYKVHWLVTVVEETEHYNWWSTMFRLGPDGHIYAPGQDGNYSSESNQAEVAFSATILRTSGASKLSIQFLYNHKHSPEGKIIGWGGDSIVYSGGIPENGRVLAKVTNRPDYGATPKPGACFTNEPSQVTYQIPSIGQKDSGFEILPNE